MRLWLVLALAVRSAAASPNHAAAFAWRTGATTDLELGPVIAADHTVVVRFLPQYAKALAGPLLEAVGYRVGIGAYGPGVHLEVVIGGARGTYAFGDATEDAQAVPLERAWHTLVLVRAGNQVTVQLDGRRLGQLAVTPADTVHGKLQLGRADDRAQYYGLIDDVAVFERALAKPELDAIAHGKRLDARAGPLRAWTFDAALPDGAPLPVAFAHPVQGVALVDVSADRDARADVAVLPPPVQQATLALPFPPGVEWRVTQEYEGPTGHAGAGAFAYDFVRSNGDTCGAEVVAPADGTLVDGCDVGDPRSKTQLAQGCTADYRFGPLVDGYDFAHVAVAPDEVVELLHIQRRSLRERFPDHAAEFASPAPPAVNVAVVRGQPLARAGTRKPNNCHLHFAVTTKAGVGIPVAFSRYEVLDPRTRTWKLVARGIPKFHDYIRNPRTVALPAR